MLPSRDDGEERAGVFLTNALTGWDKETGEGTQSSYRCSCRSYWRSATVPNG